MPARLDDHRGVRRRLPDRGAAEPGPRRRQLPQRPVRARRLLAVGQLVVRRTPPARLLACWHPPWGRSSGPRLVAAISMTVAAALFAVLIDGRFPASATRIAAAWFALGAGDRAALQPRPVRPRPGDRPGLRCCSPSAIASAPRSSLALLTSLASPVAGAFLALAFLAWALAGPTRAWPAALTLAALAPIALLELAFPEGGAQPFVASAFYPALVGVLVIGAVIPPRAARAEDRHGAVRADADRLLRGAERRRRQRRPARRAGRRPARRVRAAPARPAGAGGCWWRSRRSCSTGRPTPRSPTSPRPPRTRPSTPPTTPPCSASCTRSASATAHARRGSRSFRRSITGRRAGWRRTR